MYMAPEVLRGELASVKSDIYSTGIVFYEMLYGVCPWEAHDIESLLKKLDTSALIFRKEINPHVSNQTELLLMSMLDINAKKRISLEELAKLTQTALKDFQIEDNNFSMKFSNLLTEGNSPGKNNNLVNEIKKSSVSLYYDKDFEAIKKIMKERCKLIYLSNVIAAIIDINLSKLSGFVICYLLKYMIEISRILLGNFLSSEKIANKILIRNSNDASLIFSYLKKENSTIKENFNKYKELIYNNLSNSNDKIIEFFEKFNEDFDLKVYNDLMLQYFKLLKARSLMLFNEKKESLTKNFLIHANNILDAIMLENFFEMEIFDDQPFLQNQLYFEKISSMSNDSLFILINKKYSKLLLQI